MFPIADNELRWPVAGHNRAVEMLARSIRRDLLSHAYLFIGTQGVGKHTLARALAMTLNCQTLGPDGLAPTAPCGLCASCSRIRAGEHPDLIEVSLAAQAVADESSRRSPPKEIRIDTVREMQRTVDLKPYMGRWKIFIVADADRLNEEASNALLKTLEEPPEDTVLVLLAPDESAVLPTISSRCFVVPLRPASRAIVRDFLMETKGADARTATRLAALSGGRIGAAISMFEDRGSLTKRSQDLENMSTLLGATTLSRVEKAKELADRFTKSRAEVYETLDVWEGWWRDVLIVQAAAPDIAANGDQLSTLESLARRVPSERVYRVIRSIGEARRQLEENVHPRLALESLMLGLP